MMEAPFLTPAEVRLEVERIFRRDHRSQLVALFGRGEACDFELAGHRWRVVPTQCELDLRERLPQPGELRERSVFLVDWVAEVLPLDVACRLAGGRLYHVARDARLAALFGARQVEPGLASSALAKAFLSGLVGTPRKIQGLQLTFHEAWASLLSSRFGLPEHALLSPGALLGWAAASDAGPPFVRLAEGDDLWRNVRRELAGWIRGTAGEAASVVWAAWEQGLARRLLEVLPLLESARASEDAFVSGQLAGQLSAWLPSLAAAIRAVEATLAAPATIDAALPSAPQPLLSTLDASQALAEGAGLSSLTTSSPRLPGGHRARERALADAVRAFLDAPDDERATIVVDRLSQLEAHALDPHLRPDNHRRGRRNVARLVLWLSSRDASAPSGTRWQPAADLARRQSEEGGHVEWSRQQLRGLRGADEVLLDAARSLDAAAARVLREDHRTFAEAYVSWLEAGKPSADVMPIEDVGKQVIAPFLRGGDHRRLLVVLMDGMSHGTAVPLLTRLARARRWGPIAWRREGWRGLLPLPPVLAAAPTLTHVSRSAFFAGTADPRFGNEPTDKDPARWQAHRALAHLRGDDDPPLFVRRDLVQEAGLSQEVNDAIRSKSRVVAVVVNAIDEDLKSSVQVEKDYEKSAVLPLDALLSAAEEGERVVLLVADHGHVPGVATRRLERRLGRDRYGNERPGGRRWRALAAGEAPEADEVALPRTSWSPPGWDRVAVLWDPAVMNRSADYGEHGGLSLAEAVAPAVLIAPDWLERTVPDDPELAVRPLPTPRWWDLHTRRAAPRQDASAVGTTAPSQAVLFASPTVEAPDAAAPVPPAFVGALQRSPVFQSAVAGLSAADRERVLSWLTLLVEAGGALSSNDFAAAAGVRPHQVGGVVARMGVLNADGFAMIEHDHVGRRVILHRARLAQHYGIKE